MRPNEVIKRLEADGWVALKGGKTSHKHFKHPVKIGKVTVSMHAGDINPITLKSIEKQSGVKMN